MRMMMRVSVPIEAANKAVQDGSMKKILQAQLEKLRPESVYFFADDDVRTALLFIDVQEESDLLAIADPFFQGVNARIRFTPVMNAQDFQAGMAKLAAR
ncbi:MAG TPA: hypothetical protein VFH68_25225 [Polyangia bacterium]|jgi:hypothetical protein|nr:hypothetical protein [Polyangia bacterium]